MKYLKSMLTDEINHAFTDPSMYNFPGVWKMSDENDENVTMLYMPSKVWLVARFPNYSDYAKSSALKADINGSETVFKKHTIDNGSAYYYCELISESPYFTVRKPVIASDSGETDLYMANGYYSSHSSDWQNDYCVILSENFDKLFEDDGLTYEKIEEIMKGDTGTTEYAETKKIIEGKGLYFRGNRGVNRVYKGDMEMKYCYYMCALISAMPRLSEDFDFPEWKKGDMSAMFTLRTDMPLDNRY